MENNSPDHATHPSVQKKKKSVFREYAEAIFIALLLALFIRTFIVQAFKIPSGSMKKTLLIGDHILVSKFAYGTHIPNVIPFLNIKLFDDIVLFQKIPKHGDIIVFKYPKNESRDFIKRVIGLPGDLLEVRQQKVYINEKLIEEEHVQHTDPPGTKRLVPRDDFGPVMVPPGHLFVMGDNRENSQDSRFWGFLDIKKIKGKALVIYWSWNSEDSWVRFDRFGQILR
jgi:signal peptidase I|tara:strand:+ start:2928 stop:3605 length:678 start_codon:yes stop_codon:yes gene_type:complete